MECGPRDKSVNLPEGTKCVRLRRDQGTPLARGVINDRDVYGVMAETKTCFHLFDISQYCASREMKRMGAGGRVQFRKNWFDAAEPEPREPEPREPEPREPEPRKPEPAAATDTVPAKHKYTLRKSNLPSEVLIWDAHGGVDRYTGRPREHYASLKTPVHRDHVLEVQMLDTVLETAFPRTGELDAGGVEVARQVLFPFLNGDGEFRKELLNLNNTEDILNQYWKGGSVRVWRRHFHETGGDVKLMRQRLGGDASLAALMRASMRVDSDGQAVQALAVDKWKGRGARAQASYRPAWARAVDSAMGVAGRKLVERLREHDGQTHFMLVADGLEDLLCKMELKGFAR
jgi:hypothetical protein